VDFQMTSRFLSATLRALVALAALCSAAAFAQSDPGQKVEF